VKITRCPPICGRKKKKEKNREVRKIEEEKMVKELVPKKFWKWKKVFGKAELERMPVQKAWDHTIDLKRALYLRKERYIHC